MPIQLRQRQWLRLLVRFLGEKFVSALGAILHPQRYRERLLGALVVDSSKIRNTLGYIKLIAL